jgi:hypothetical protein
MARANRHYRFEQIWYLTHRCHRRRFLLKFARDRQAGIDWLFEASKRFGLGVGREVILDSLQRVSDAAARNPMTESSARAS